MNIEEFITHLDRVKQKGDGYMASCPGPNHANGDRNPSLSIDRGHNDNIVIKCFGGCSNGEIMHALRLPMYELFEQPKEQADDKVVEVDRYPYYDLNGEKLYDVVRYSDKTFRPFVPGHDKAGYNGTGRVLYQLPRIPDSMEVWVAEGEKDVNALIKAGVAATCNPGGSNAWGTVAEQAREVLAGKQVTIVADKDGPGAKWAEQVFNTLVDVASDVWVVEAAVGKDAADHLGAGKGLDDFIPLYGSEKPPVAPSLFVGWEHHFPEPTPLIEGVLDLGNVGVLYARWGCFKSFLALDWGLHVACGIDWYEHATTQAPVAILAYEAPMSLHQRAHAWAKHHGINPGDDWYLAPSPPRLTNIEEMKAVAEALDKAGVGIVIVDTIARGGVGSDMNNHEADLVFQGLHALASPTRVVLGIGHAGKDASRGLRGYSAQEDQVDLIYRLDRERDGNTQQPKGPATLTNPKAKDRDTLAPMTFNLAESPLLLPNERVLLRGTSAGAGGKENAIESRIKAFMARQLEEGNVWVPHTDITSSCKDSRGISKGDVATALERLVEYEYLDQMGPPKAYSIRPDVLFTEGS